MALVITIANQKGGVCKTTTALLFSAGLNQKGYKSLLIDADPQADLSFAVEADTKGNTLKEVLEGECSAKDAIQHTHSGDIIASKPQLAGTDKKLKDRQALKKVIAPLKELYDFIVIDTPRALAMLAINAFTASDKVIATATADAYTLNAVLQLDETLNMVKAKENPALTLEGILLCKQDTRTNISRELETILRNRAEKKLHTKVYKTVIRQGKHIREAALMQENLFTYAPHCNPAVDYMSFINEFLAEYQKPLF